MGGISRGWEARYEFEQGGWHQLMRVCHDSTTNRLILISDLRNPTLDPKHPFSQLLGVTVGHFRNTDLWYVLAEIERPLKPARNLLFYRLYRPTIRAIFPDDRSSPQIGLMIADPKEQKKLSLMFREALTRLET